MYLAAIMVYALLIAPVIIKIDMAAQRNVTGRIAVSIWGVSVVYHFTFVRDENSKWMVQYRKNGKNSKNSSSAGDGIGSLVTVLSVIKHGNISRKLLLKSTHVIRVRAIARISLSDAAHTALLSELVRQVVIQLSLILSKKDIRHTFRTWPDFTQKGSACQGNCILFARLGNLTLAAALIKVLIMWMGKQERMAEEVRKWNTPLGTL